MERMKKIYELLEPIGSGSFSQVWKGKHKATGQLVAIKQLERTLDIDHTGRGARGLPSSTLREVTILNILTKEVTPYIVRLFYFHKFTKPSEDSGKEHMFLVMEYISSDLRKYISLHREPDEGLSQSITFGNIKIIMYQICKGIEILHGKGVVHRDLKPANILLNPQNLMVKFADFGFSREITFPTKAHYSPGVMTLFYKAPELLLGADEYSFPVDMWSIGCIFGELVTLNPIFSRNTPVEQLRLMCSVLGPPNEDTWPGVTKLRNFEKCCDTPLTPGWSKCFRALGEDGIDLLMVSGVYF
ncbi:Protein kinase domain [Macleaya cordata]|uniref:Protein kinase domain n=1 Tax=Macleaya cordata TaxID=56857 RepID=A0A200PMG6_MACCD|nr:Protein kinase domain [Macleaya cordata]